MSQDEHENGSQTDNIRTTSVRRVFLGWTAAAFILGATGAYFGKNVFDAPYYFGFFVAFTLVGLAGMFALAVMVDKLQNQRPK
ncbi:MAG: hypothetical protein H7Z41_10175 [Cytophagales bacterium]|nr:hypothetical protein [Armatimonadota bacterium]